MITFWRSDHMRSPMMARAMTEQSMSGQIGQPAASMIENTRTLRFKCARTLYGGVCTTQGEAQVVRDESAIRSNRAASFSLFHSVCG